MKVLVLGAGGIVGQHMYLQIPRHIEALFVKRTTSHGMIGADATRFEVLDKIIRDYAPQVIVNLAGENNVDIVEKDKENCNVINCSVPTYLAVNYKNIKVLQVSTQAVFSGEEAPYQPEDKTNAINEYGRQKARAEANIRASRDDSTYIVTRLTFVLGVRPFPELGRKNPLEDMLERERQLQVDDRFFSPVFANDAADILWELAEKLHCGENERRIYHIGQPIKLSRFDVATRLVSVTENKHNPEIKPVSHDYFPSLAARAKNTQWAEGSLYKTDLDEGLIKYYVDWRKRKEVRNA